MKIKVSCLVLLGLLLTGVVCLCYASTEKPRYGGILKIIDPGLITNIGCPGASSTNADVIYMIPSLEYLVRYDENGLPTPHLATGWEIASDLKSTTFTLRKGVKFHDGTDFNAEAVKFNFDLYRKTKAPDFRMVTSIDVIDDYTVRFNFKEYQAQFLSSLNESQYAGIVSPTAYKTHGPEWCTTHPVGTGPFKIADFKRDVHVKYERFDDYWQKGKPYLDGIEFLIIADPNTQLMTFEGGEAHVNYNVNMSNACRLKPSGKYKLHTAAGFVAGLAGDSAHPESPFADVRVRQAVEYAINKKALVKGAFMGFTQTTDQIVPAGYWAYNPEVNGYPYNPEKARQLLAEAGYPNGFKTRLIVDNTMSQEAAAIEQSYLKKVGIDAKLEVVSPLAYMKYRLKGWDDGLLTYTTSCQFGYDTGRALKNMICSKFVNVGLVCIPELEDLITRANAEPDFKKRQTIMRDLVKVWHEKAYTTPIYLWQKVAMVSNKVHDSNIFDPAGWGLQWTPENAWLSE